MSSEPLRVAIIGLGTVGTGVTKILQNESERITRRAGRPIRIARVVVKNLQKEREVSLPEDVLIDDVETVIADPDIDVVLQLIGGINPAWDIMWRLVDAGKDIITANKALLCEHGDALFSHAKDKGRCIAFEAAVAGGVPIISTINQSMTANQITSIQAILNGTSNFILTEMLNNNSNYEDVLKQAQELGYAEADPSMDVDGTDAAQKLIILTQLAFGKKIPLESITQQGIDSLELADLTYVQELGYTVKLLAVVRLVGDQLEMHVQPTLVKHHRPLAQVDGPFNMIALEGDAVGKTWYSGPGAGQMATASAVVADLIDVAVGRAQLTFSAMDFWNENVQLKLQPPEENTGRYYLRFNVEDKPHVFADITDILGKHGINLASVIQHEAPEVADSSAGGEAIVPVVVMTHRTSAGRLQAAEAELDRLATLKTPIVRMPVDD